MRLALAILLLPLLAALAQTNALFTSAPLAAGNLSFKYPAAETHSNLSFKVYTSPSLTIPHTNWQVLTQFSSVATNLFTTADGTNTYLVRVPVWHGMQFYTATATDSFWGESFFSNEAWTNPLPRLDNRLQLSR